jgi:hypothetical protein
MRPNSQQGLGYIFYLIVFVFMSGGDIKAIILYFLLYMTIIATIFIPLTLSQVFMELILNICPKGSGIGAIRQSGL